jgi:hypothetical protein
LKAAQIHVSDEALQAVLPLKAAQIHMSGKALQAVHPLGAAQIHMSGEALQAVHPLGAAPPFPHSVVLIWTALGKWLTVLVSVGAITTTRGWDPIFFGENTFLNRFFKAFYRFYKIVRQVAESICQLRAKCHAPATVCCGKNYKFFRATLESTSTTHRNVFARIPFPRTFYFYPCGCTQAYVR